MKRTVAGVAALVVVVGLLVGIPAALVLFAGNPFPTWDELSRVLTGFDYGGQFIIGTLLPLAGWIAWLSMAIAIVAEIPAQLRRIPAPKLPLLGLQQKGASLLIGAIIGMATVGVGATAATAAEPSPLAAASTVAVASQTPVDNPAGGPKAPAAETVAPVPDQPAAPTYTVQNGDSLWKIAETELGHGERWQEIAVLNYGIEQPDGWALDTQHWLNAGWVLTLPADAAAPAPTAVPGTTVTQHTVVPGDTLWDIAEDTTGDGTNYPQIVDATDDYVQPDGRQLTDPNLIIPGWVVTIPTDTTAAPVPPPDSTPVPPPEDPAPVPPSEQPPAATPENQPAPDAQDVPAGSGVDVAQAAPVPDLSGIGLGTTPGQNAQTPERPAGEVSSDARATAGDVDDWLDDVAVNVRTPGGLGAIAAAGLLSLLGILRMKQLRRRRLGQRIAMPDGDAAVMELELRAVENPMGMHHVDHALRYLAVWAQASDATLPRLYALRLADTEIALYLDEPCDLPAPYVAVTDDKKAWTVDPEQLPDLERTPSAPYPALVTLGQDNADGHLLVDLERVGALNVTGHPATVAGALTALAVELATSRWGEDLRVTLVGVAPGLPAALDTGRVRHVDDIPTLMRALRAQAASTRAALDELGVASIEEARSLDASAESWTPEIVILGELPDQATRDELADLVTRVPRIGVAAIAVGDLAGEWTLHVSDDHTADLSMPDTEDDLSLTPQIVNSEELDRITRLVHTTGQDATQVTAVLEEVPLDEIPVTTVGPAALTSVDDHQPAASDRADTTAVNEPEQESESPTPEPVAAAPDLFPVGVPWVQILGPVQLHEAQGDEPRTPQTSESNRSAVNRATELLAYLALHPGESYVTVHAAMWWKEDASGEKAAYKRNKLTSQARKWIGDSSDGQEWFPKVGIRGYRLDPRVRTDWHVFQELVGDDLAHAETENLVTALRLVKGQPFSGVRARYYRWADEERLRTDIIQRIGDVAHELVTRSLRTGRIGDARLAASVGRRIEPENETHWRDAMRGEALAGSRAEFERVVTHHEEQLDSFEDGYEPEPETVELIDRIRARLTVGR